MTLPFENDTSRIVKRLAKQNMKANRRTSISIMVAILIASTFFVFVMHIRPKLLESKCAAGDRSLR